MELTRNLFCVRRENGDLASIGVVVNLAEDKFIYEIQVETDKSWKLRSPNFKDALSLWPDWAKQRLNNFLEGRSLDV